MPSRAVTITMRDQAQATIKRAAATLSERFGVALDEASIHDGRDPDYLRARELERLATFMSGLAEKVAANETDAKDAEALLRKAEVERDAATSALNACKADIDKLTAENAALTDAIPKNDGATPVSDAMQRLVGLAVTDEMVRLALVEAGFVQAKQDDDGGDWSVSIVGLGPDLDALNAATTHETAADARTPPAKTAKSNTATTIKKSS